VEESIWGHNLKGGTNLVDYWGAPPAPGVLKLGRPKKDWDPSNILHLNHMFAVVPHSYEVILTNP